MRISLPTGGRWPSHHTHHVNAGQVIKNGDAAGDTAVDQQVGFENLTGSAHDDWLVGDSGDNLIEGGAGRDVIDGGAGSDTASYASSNAGVQVITSIAVTANSNVKGSALAAGDAGKYVITELQANGSWTVSLGTTSESESATKKILGRLDSTGRALDTNFLNAGLSINSSSILAAGAVSYHRGVGGHATGDLLQNVENLIGSSYADILTGDAGVNIIKGGAGADTIHGLGGNDSLYGGTGRDTIMGGAGDDVIEGGADADKLTGGAGNDTVSYAHSNAGVSIDLNISTAQGGQGHGTGDVLAGFEHITGSNYDDVLYGNDGVNVIRGGKGDDRLYGRAGNDTLHGGEGNDTLDGGSGDDTLNGGAGNDTLYGRDGKDTLNGGEGADRLYGNAGNDTLDGGAGADTIEGGTGHDVVKGSEGKDTIDGGTGFDTLDYSALVKSDGSERLRILEGKRTDAERNSDNGFSGKASRDEISNTEYIIAGAGKDTVLGDGSNTIFEGGGAGDTIDGGDHTTNGKHGLLHVVDGSAQKSMVIGSVMRPIAARLSGYSSRRADKL